jgi:hypothetical protein
MSTKAFVGAPWLGTEALDLPVLHSNLQRNHQKRQMEADISTEMQRQKIELFGWMRQLLTTVTVKKPWHCGGTETHFSF